MIFMLIKLAFNFKNPFKRTCNDYANDFLLKLDEKVTK